MVIAMVNCQSHRAMGHGHRLGGVSAGTFTFSIEDLLAPRSVNMDSGHGSSPWAKAGWVKYLPSGKRLHSYGKSPSFIGKSTINGPFSIVMLNYQRVSTTFLPKRESISPYHWLLMATMIFRATMQWSTTRMRVMRKTTKPWLFRFFLRYETSRYETSTIKCYQPPNQNI